MTLSASTRKTACRVTDCDDPTDLFLCRRHTSRLRELLTGSATVLSINALLAELDVTISRQDVGTGAPLAAVRKGRVQVPGVHYEEGDSALPSTAWAFGWDASNTKWTVEATLQTWARHIAETRDVPATEPPLLDDAWLDDAWDLVILRRTVRLLNANPARFLAEHLDSIRLDEAAGELFDEIRAAHRDALQAVDRQVPDEFLGRCDAMVMTTHLVDTAAGDALVPEVAPCGTDLYIRVGDDDVKCGTCGAVYDVRDQRASLKEMLPEAVGTPAVIADALTRPGAEVDRVQLNRWIERDAKQTERDKEGPTCEPALQDGELTDCRHVTCKGLRSAERGRRVKRQGRPMIFCRGWNEDGKALYRVGDVQDRLAWWAGENIAARRAS